LNQPDFQPILEATDLSVTYSGRKVLDISSLQVAPNQVTAIIGPNGSGKTTLSLCLSLLLKPTLGYISFKGHKVPDGESLLQMRRHFAVVFQEPLLLNGTVMDNITLGLRLRGVKNEEIKKRADYWLERFGISRFSNRNARTLSGGEAQRTTLARAFALQPEVLFLDEPFAALDVPTRQSLFGDVFNILQETKCTTILVTHDRNEAQSLGHKILVLMNGTIVQSGTPKEIFSSPANEEIAKFVGVENILDGQVVSNKNCITDIDISGQIIEGVSNCLEGKVYVCIRPEDITISRTKSSTSARNVFEGKINSLISEGPLVRAKLDCGFSLIALITRLSADELKLEIGTSIFASFKATAIHIIDKKS
jgi:tungstate transport system ATP-binding protein